MTGRSYAILWRESGEAARVYAGKLELACDRLRLEGASAGRAAAQEVAYAELVSVHVARAASERIAGCPALLLERARGRALLLASAGGIGLLRELADALSLVAPGVLG